MAGESNALFDNLPPPYRAMPTSRNIEDRRNEAIDYAQRMRNFGRQGGFTGGYRLPSVRDPTRNMGVVANPNIGGMTYNTGDYSASFDRNFNPQFVNPGPYQRHPLSDALPYTVPHEPWPLQSSWNAHGDAPEPQLTPEQINDAMQLWQGGGQ